MFKNTFDNPWLNSRLIIGSIIIGFIVFGSLLGRFVWDPELSVTSSSPLNLPPYGFTNLRKQNGVIEHPLGTDNSGRDMLAVLIVGTPRTMSIGILAAGAGMVIGILWATSFNA